MGYGTGFYDLTYDDEYRDMSAEGKEAQKQQSGRRCCLTWVPCGPVFLPWCTCTWQQFFCVLGAIMGFVAIGFGIACLVFSQTYKAQDPVFTIQRFQVSGFHFNNNGALVFDPQPDGMPKPFVNVTSLIVNPNSYQLFVDFLSISVYFSNMLIARSTSPGLPAVHGGQNMTAVVPFDLNAVPAFQGTGGHVLLGTLFGSKMLDLQFTINTKDHVKMWNYSPPPVLVRVTCNITIEPMKATILGQNCTKYHKNVQA